MKSTTEISKPNRRSAAATTGRLFFSKQAAAEFIRLTPTARTEKSFSTGAAFRTASLSILKPGHIYWTNMGVPNSKRWLDRARRSRRSESQNDRSRRQRHSRRSNSISIKKSGKLYWCDREGMRVMRANLDGSEIETLVDTSKGDARPGTDETKVCVGITVDPDRGQIYWTQKGPD